jgi:hypothetical protein
MAEPPAPNYEEVGMTQAGVRTWVQRLFDTGVAQIAAVA